MLTPEPGSQSDNVSELSIDHLARSVHGVQGWMSVRELWEIFSLVHQRAGSGKALVLVEIGAWIGRSTIAMALALKSQGRGVLFSVDPHEGYLDYGIRDTYPLLIDNLQKADLTTFVEVVRGTSHIARDKWEGQQVDLILHDGPRGFEEALEEFAEWESTLAPGASVIVVDPFKKSRALQRTILRHRSPYRFPRMFRNLLIVRYQPDLSWQFADALRAAATLARVRLWTLPLAALYRSPPIIRRALLATLHRIRDD
jgi:predicted O-methyltransferase YrrM